MVLVLKRTVSLKLFFEYRQHMFWLRNKKIIFGYALLTSIDIQNVTWKRTSQNLFRFYITC